MIEEQAENEEEAVRRIKVEIQYALLSSLFWHRHKQHCTTRYLVISYSLKMQDLKATVIHG